jgi:hypothetical protein
MTKEQILKLTQIIEIVVKREISKSLQPALNEIREIGALLKEQRNTHQQTVQARPQAVKKPAFDNPLLSQIFEEMAPFDAEQEEGVTSILDASPTAGMTPQARKIMEMINTKDFTQTVKKSQNTGINYRP